MQFVMSEDVCVHVKFCRLDFAGDLTLPADFSWKVSFWWRSQTNDDVWNLVQSQLLRRFYVPGRFEVLIQISGKRMFVFMSSSAGLTSPGIYLRLPADFSREV